MTNSAKMTLEERLVQKIKGDTLASLIGDEDAILELTKRAIQEALFQPQRTPKQYGGYTEMDSIAVAAARAAANRACDKIATETVTKLMSDQAVRAALDAAFAKMMPGAIYHWLNQGLEQRLKEAGMEIEANIRNAISQGTM